MAGNHKQMRLGDTTTFYFSQFPEDHGAREMLRIFSLYGEAAEVVIPPKLDKLGRRFGFVRFWRIRDPDRFAIKLDNIIIGSTKIHVNCPRFNRDTSKQAEEKHHTLRGRREDHRKEHNLISKHKDGEKKDVEVCCSITNGKKETDETPKAKKAMVDNNEDKGKHEDAQKHNQNHTTRKGVVASRTPFGRKRWGRRKR